MSVFDCFVKFLATLTDKNRKFDCADCVLDETDACPRGAGRAVDSEVCEDFIEAEREEEK